MRPLPPIGHAVVIRVQTAGVGRQPDAVIAPLQVGRCAKVQKIGGGFAAPGRDHHRADVIEAVGKRAAGRIDGALQHI